MDSMWVEERVSVSSSTSCCASRLSTSPGDRQLHVRDVRVAGGVRAHRADDGEHEERR